MPREAHWSAHLGTSSRTCSGMMMASSTRPFANSFDLISRRAGVPFPCDGLRQAFARDSLPSLRGCDHVDRADFPNQFPRSWWFRWSHCAEAVREFAGGWVRFGSKPAVAAAITLPPQWVDAAGSGQATRQPLLWLGRWRANRPTTGPRDDAAACQRNRTGPLSRTHHSGRNQPAGPANAPPAACGSHATTDRRPRPRPIGRNALAAPIGAPGQRATRAGRPAAPLSPP